nr:unnamed protein product [Spirometra erinaceieuropaei]
MLLILLLTAVCAFEEDDGDSREMCYMRFQIGDCEDFDERYGYDPLNVKMHPRYVNVTISIKTGHLGKIPTAAPMRY